jgi:GNAT superfamily N-acetyltransferase
MPVIKLAESDAEILACYPVMLELRPHLASADAFLAQVRRQEKESHFQLAYLADPDVRSVAGIRIAEWLPSGRTLEIEDLATHSSSRSSGYGSALFDWVVAYARTSQCQELKLVSHVARFDAHRFYFSKRMKILAYHFTLDL